MKTLENIDFPDTPALIGMLGIFGEVGLGETRFSDYLGVKHSEREVFLDGKIVGRLNLYVCSNDHNPTTLGEDTNGMTKRLTYIGDVPDNVQPLKGNQINMKLVGLMYDLISKKTIGCDTDILFP